MFFKSTTAAKTWDCCATYRDGTYYLYYLISDQFVCDGLALATSVDGIHWQDHGWVLRHSDQMVRYLGSGSVWKDLRQPAPSAYLCNYSEWRMEGGVNVQHIYFASSSDLIQWQKLGDGASFDIDPLFYQRTNLNARGSWEDPRWDGMCAITRQEGGYYGYWTATPNQGLSFGFGISPDGLHWQALKPPSIKMGTVEPMIFIEVGGVHEIEGRYYAMLGDYASTHCGMFAFVADSPAGPFRPTPKNHALLRNQGRMHAYFSRFFKDPTGPLVCHHVLAEGQFSHPSYQVYYPPFKRPRVIGGSLYLTWWDGNEAIKSAEEQYVPGDRNIEFDAQHGVLVEGELALPGEILIDTGNETATVILADAAGVCSFGSARSDGSAFSCEEQVDRELEFGNQPPFRLLLYHTMLELYLDDVLVLCYTLPRPATGRLGLPQARRLTIFPWRHTRA